jgi:hypothetical protein
MKIERQICIGEQVIFVNTSIEVNRVSFLTLRKGALKIYLDVRGKAACLHSEDFL